MLNLKSCKCTTSPVCLIDTEFPEEYVPELLPLKKYRNRGQADIVVSVVSDMLDNGLHAEDIAIIAGYRPQVDFISELIESELGVRIDVMSVDGSQGREKPVIIFSTVRCNDERSIRNKRREITLHRQQMLPLYRKLMLADYVLHHRTRMSRTASICSRYCQSC